ncbi:MAG TPA: methyl-accepting chemotaxis protein, partial [Ktedonobacteraceae bacterium]|nr:methyl-accepting chemotaxis protein [Ktedonobacteraceae bacterium]
RVSAEASQDALQNAKAGQSSVRQSIEGMQLIRENVQETSKKIKRLGERSNEIGEIVRIIEDIADQTNLLALNAAIQSAMAGEHGRGFAVVADEIRLLAERSTESTKRIATLVNSIQGDTYEAVVAMEDSTQEVVKGSQLADEAGRSLNSIYSAVERQAQMIESIARAAHEQTSVSEAVAVAMSRISEITRQTDAGTQEAAVSVSYLAELAEQLRASVSTFRLPERTNEMLGSFSNMPSPAELPGANGNQMFPGQPAQVFSGQPAQVFSSQPGQAFSGQQGNEWDQGFAGNFPPLPEPGNTGSLVASLPSRNGSAGQYNFNNQNDFGGQQFSGQPNFGGQQFSGQPNFGGQQPFGGIPSGPGASQNYNSAQFGGQDFGNMGNLEGQQGFGSGGWYGAGQQFGGAPGAGYGSQNPPFAAGPNSGLLSLPAQGQFNPNQRWSGSLDQNQSPFGNDQIPFRDNG